MSIIVQIDKDTEQSYDADQGVTEKDGTLHLYKWEEITCGYKCPERKTLVATFAPGRWSNYFRDR